MWAFNRAHTCAYLAIVISALKQAMRLNKCHSVPFEMGFLAVTVLSGFKFLPNLIKYQGCFFPEMASKFYFALVTSVKISYTTQQNGICLSCIGCCSADTIDEEIRSPMWAFNRGERLIEYMPT